MIKKDDVRLTAIISSQVIHLILDREDAENILKSWFTYREKDCKENLVVTDKECKGFVFDFKDVSFLAINEEVKTPGEKLAVNINKHYKKLNDDIEKW